MKKVEIKKSEINKIKKFIKKTPLFVARNVVQVSMGLLLLAFIIGAVFFYKCNILSVKREVETLDNSCPLNESNYNKVLEVWNRNDQKFNEASFKYHDNIFSGEIID